MKHIPRHNHIKGQVMLTVVIIFLVLSMTIVFGIVGPILKQASLAQENLSSTKSYYTAESGMEDIFIRLQKGTAIATNETMNLNGGSTALTTTDTVGGKQIVSVGNVNNDIRKLVIAVTRGSGVVFKYGTQSGQGGFVLDNNSILNGSLYSNGNILGSNGAQITGDAIVAGSSGLLDTVVLGGQALAHTVRNTTATGLIYCQVGSNNNKACNTSQADPPIITLPVSDEQITQWENDAAAGGVVTGNTTISSASTVGPKKYVGNLTISGALTLSGTIYVTGNITISGNVKLASSYGASSGVIIADGYIDVNNGVIFQDSGTTGSYILFLSNSACDQSISGVPCNSHDAITVGNNSNITIMNAQKGTVYFANNSSVKEAVGYKLHLKNNSTISYGSGVINPTFTSGPSGGYVITNVSETE